jgi:hypothetical protein
VKHRIAFINLPHLAVFLVLASTALASSTWYVDGVHGSDSNNCKTRHTACKTIGHAISLAHSGDSIMVASALYSENLTIRRSLKVIGAPTTIIDGEFTTTPVVTISNANAHVALSKLTIRDGYSGISNSGTLTINNSTVSGNRSIHGGGGIANSGTLTINNSTVSGNCAGSSCFRSVTVNYQAPPLPNGFGGGILNNGTVTINNSTLSGNSATLGGGIFGGGLKINNSTISGNSASGTIGGIDGPATLQNTIVANNRGGNCSGTITSNGYNLSSDNTCNFNSTGDLNNTDPKLGQLGNYGGPTQTIPLLAGSPAIDAGNPGGCTDGQGHLLKTDQRGKPRPDREDAGGCDMGAYERQKD